jgi:mannose-6-phosphate isomerase-like protein (cupin superfamily)
MLVLHLNDCTEFVAGDNTILREILHPNKQSVQLRYSLAHAVVKPGEVSLPHRLATSEVYYILEGKGMMHIDGEQAEVGPGQAVYIPSHSVQFIRNTGEADLKFLCIVDPAWRAEDEEVLDAPTTRT